MGTGHLRIVHRASRGLRKPKAAWSISIADIGLHMYESEDPMIKAHNKIVLAMKRIGSGDIW